MKLRTVLLLAGLLAVLGLSLSSAGSSATAAERGIQTEVTNDGEAYLGFQQETVTRNGTTRLTVTVANQFPIGTTLDTIEISVGGQATDAGPLDVGEDETVTFKFVECDDTIFVKAADDGVLVSLSRAVECD